MLNLKQGLQGVVEQIHLTFVISGILLALMDWITSKTQDAPQGETHKDKTISPRHGT